MDDNILDQKWSAGSLLRFAFPTIVMMIFMGLYTIVDRTRFPLSILFAPLSISRWGWGQ